MISAPLFSTMCASSLIALQSERNRLASILHSQVAPLLTAAGLQMEALRMDFPGSHPEFAARASEIQERLEAAMRTIRELSAELNPNVAEKLGLRAGLILLLETVQHRFPRGAILDFAPGVSVSNPVSGALYSIAEQAVENAVRHSGASRLEVRVQLSAGSLVMEIRDDGRGFDPGKRGEQPMGVGLPLMVLYAEQCGGQVHILSDGTAGTVVRVELNRQRGTAAPPTAEGPLLAAGTHAE